MNKKGKQMVRLAKGGKMGGVVKGRKFEFREVEVEGRYACDLGVFITIIKNRYIEKSRMSHKLMAETSGLVLDSRIRDNSQPTPHLLHKMPKLTNTPMHSLTMHPSLRRGSEAKSQDQQLSSECSAHHNSLPLAMSKANSFEPSGHHKAGSELCRLREEKDILQRNFIHEVEYYIRQRMKDLVTIQQLLLANQYQRLFKYVETQLQLLRKKHDAFLFDEDCCKPVLTRDTFLKSNIEDDFHYHEIVNNLVTHLSKNDKTSSSLTTAIKKLTCETDLTVRKLAYYLEQFPFELSSPPGASQSLANRLVSEMGLSQGRQVVEQISKTVGQNTKGKYSITLQQSGLKSEMSKLIEEHSLTKIKSKKSSF